MRSSACGSLGYGKTLCDVSWHPTEHLVAMCCFGGDYPILLFEAEHAHAADSGYEGKGEHGAYSLNTGAGRFSTPTEGGAIFGRDREQRRAQYLQDRTQLLNDRLKGLERRTLTTVRRGMKQKIEDRRILKPVESLRQ